MIFVGSLFLLMIPFQVIKRDRELKQELRDEGYERHQDCRLVKIDQGEEN